MNYDKTIYLFRQVGKPSRDSANMIYIIDVMQK